MVWRAASLIHMKLIPFGTLALSALLLVPATWTIAALFMAVAALARDSKDAGNFLAPLLLVVLSPIAATLFPGMELNSWTCFAPLANLSLLIRSLLLGETAGHLIFLTLLSSLAYAGLALALAARVFGREQILLGGPFSWRSLLRSDAGSRGPTPGFVLTLFALILVGFFYGGLAVMDRGLLTILLVTQFGVLLLPTIGLSVAGKFPLAQTFSLRRPHWRSLVGSILIGLTAGLAVSGLVSRVVTTPEEWMREFSKLLQLGDQSAPLWKLWLVLALTPALCEETFFRGLLFSGLRRWGPWAAVGISALLFGLMHGSIYQFLPTFIIGLLLGYAVWRSGSLYCSILIHFLNNGLVATVAWSQGAKILAKAALPWSLTLGALGITLAGLALLRGPKGFTQSK
jgi:sodium transport system permease protein